MPAFKKAAPLWLALTCTLLLSHCVVTDNQDFFVPDNFHTIQGAIDAAQPGDTVFINRGYYSPSSTGEHFPIFMKDGVNLVGEDPEDTVVDAQGFASVFNVYNYNGTIQNFTLQNGFSSKGGGIYVQNSTATLSNLYVFGNQADEQGSGIFLLSSGGTEIENVVVAGNERSSSSSNHPAQVEIVDSEIHFNNNTVADGDNDGLRLSENSSGQFDNNIFIQNGADGFGVGLADTDATTNAEIAYNICFNNSEADFYLNGGDLTAQQANDLDGGDSIFNNFNADPLLNDDFTLQSGSPAIHAGDPDSSFDNPDGSRNDIGAFGGPNAINP